MTARLIAAVMAALLSALPAAAEKLKVVATFSILSDIAGRVGGDAIDLTTLVGPDADSHAFEPSAADARIVAKTQVLLVNGLAFDDWAHRLARASQSKARVVVASQGVQPVSGHHSHDHDDHADPHAWQDVRNALIYVANIERAFASADPANAAAYAANAAAYRQELQALNTGIRRALLTFAPARRKAVTTHGSFAYFERAYDVEFSSPLGTSTEAQASAKSLAALIVGVRDAKIKALFLENAADPRLMRQVARETGVELAGTLYADALSTKDGPAPTYIALMRHNVALLTAAMARGL